MSLNIEMSRLTDKSRVAQVADRQFGRISWAQLKQLDLPDSTILSWRRDGYLHRVLPHVYGVGHRAQTIESDLAAALLYAGPGAALSHATAAWWLALIEERPRQLQVTTPRKCSSLKGIRVYGRRERERILHKRLAVTSVPETLVDLAATAPLRTLRKALANADYKDLLKPDEFDAAMRRGSARLRKALEVHQPRLAHTKSQLEAMLIEICEEEGLPLPELNVRIAGWEIDALWREAKLAVELDGYGNHHTPAQLKRDRRKEMGVRAEGLTPVRYSAEQLIERRQMVRELRQLTT